jgi:hypothetical protein
MGVVHYKAFKPDCSMMQKLFVRDMDKRPLESIIEGSINFIFNQKLYLPVTGQ